MGTIEPAGGDTGGGGTKTWVLRANVQILSLLEVSALCVEGIKGSFSQRWEGVWFLLWVPPLKLLASFLPVPLRSRDAPITLLHEIFNFKQQHLVSGQKKSFIYYICCPCFLFSSVE